MMTKYFVCCHKCFETIAKQSTAASKIWLDLCAVRLKRGEVVAIQTNDMPELRDLEQNGYIVTSDTPSAVIIKIKGHTVLPDGSDFFCIKDQLHGED